MSDIDSILDAPETDEENITVSSGYGARTRKPFVRLTYEHADATVAFSPDVARTIAQRLFEAAEAAESDAAFVKLMFSDADTAPERVGEALLGWRYARKRARREVDA